MIESTNQLTTKTDKIPEAQGAGSITYISMYISWDPVFDPICKWLHLMVDGSIE